MSRLKQTSLRLPGWIYETVQNMAKAKNVNATDIIVTLLTSKLNDMGYTEADHLLSGLDKTQTRDLGNDQELSG